MRIYKIKKNSHKLTKEKARIIARLIGDGCMFKSKHRYEIKYEVKNMDLLKSFEKDIIKVYGLKPKWGTNPSGKTGELINLVRVNSILAYNDLLRYNKSYYSEDWRVPKQIINSNRDIKKVFLKAFCDDEGSVCVRNKIIRLYSINETGLKDISKIFLKDFNIATSIQSGFGLRRNVFAIIIKKEGILKFKEKIGFDDTNKRDKLKEILNNKLYKQKFILNNLPGITIK